MAADFKTAPEAAAALRQVSEAMAVRIPPCSRMAACPGKGPQDCTKGSQTSSHYSKKGRGGGGFNLVLSSSASAGSDRPSGVRVQGALASATAPVGVPSSASEARSLLEKASVMMMSVSPDTTGARTFSTAEAAHASIAHLGRPVLPRSPPVQSSSQSAPAALGLSAEPTQVPPRLIWLHHSSRVPTRSLSLRSSSVLLAVHRSLD